MDDLDTVRKRLNAGLRAALTDDCAQVLTADLRAFMAHEAGLRMRELLWASADAGWRELIAVLDADGKPEGAAVDYVRTLITRLRVAEAAITEAEERGRRERRLPPRQPLPQPHEHLDESGSVEQRHDRQRGEGEL